MNIIINEKLVPTLERLAREQNLTVEQCVVSNIEAYLSTQKRLEIVRTVESDLPTYEPIIIAKKIEVDEIQRLAEKERISDIEIDESKRI